MKHVKFIGAILFGIIGVIFTFTPVILSVIILWKLSKLLTVILCILFPIGVYLIYYYFKTMDKFTIKISLNICQ